jgi:hypothetical protein
MIAIASLTAIAITLGGWVAAKVLRSSRTQSVAVNTVKPAPAPIPQVIETPKPQPTEILPMPMLVEPIAIAVESPFAAPVEDDGRPRCVLKKTPPGFTNHRLAKRIDVRNASDLQAALANASEVGLATSANPAVGSDLSAAAKRADAAKKLFPGSVMVAKNRPELAGLPFRVGRETRLYDSDAQNMNDMSKQFRDAVIKSMNGKGPPAQAPDAERLHAILTTATSRDSKDSVIPWRWNQPEAVPCIQQMLQAEGTELRRMSCALLQEIDSEAATEALVKWAVFDIDSGNRAAAVEALRTRNRERVSALLMGWSRYPWARAVEHACEAMVELGMKENLPQLAAMLTTTDPDAPFEVNLPGTGGGIYRQEVVRVNHLRNCLMCHPASFKQTELVRGGVPDENSILPPATTPAYYNSSALQVSAATTYLKQDFSLAQKVANPGKWPAMQRFDYFVTTKKVESDAMWSYVPNVKSPYKEAIRFAIRELAGPDKDWDLEWLSKQRAKAAPVKDRRFLAAAQTYALRASPEVFIAFKMAEFQTPIYVMSGPELVAMFEKLTTNNTNVLKGTMIAYLEPLSERPDASQVPRIQRLLTVARSPEQDLREFLKAVGDERQ